MPSTLPGTIDAIVDLNHDNAIDMVKAVNDGIVAVIHKASESASFKDPAYIKRRTAALEAGLLWGAYHFSSGRDVGEQFDNFMAGTNWKKLADETTLLCLDFEPSSSGPDMSLDQAHDFVTRIKNETGRWPMIYGGVCSETKFGHKSEKKKKPTKREAQRFLKILKMLVKKPLINLKPKYDQEREDGLQRLIDSRVHKRAAARPSRRVRRFS